MGVDISAMDFSEFLYFSEQASNEEADKITAFSSFILQEELFGQYLQQEDSFDTPLMKNILKQIKEMYDRSGDLSWSQLPYRSVTSGESMDFYYFYEIHQWNYRYLMKALGASDRVGVTGVPKLAEKIGNVGTLTFLAVNPQAENLEAALDYISSFANYMMGQKDTFLLADESSYTDTPLVHGLYRLYANGVVRFAMDDSIFADQYWAYLSDELTLEEMIAESERRRKIYVGE